jgi:nucleotide-binding universal stress UspA family protein
MSVIVVGSDGSDGSRAAIGKACDLAKELGDSVTIVFGAAPTGIMGGDMAAHRDAVEERGAKVLEGASHQAEGAGITAETKIAHAHPVDALIEEAKSAGARMIVVGGQGESALKGAIVGSIPHKLLHLADVPVLVVPAAE